MQRKRNLPIALSVFVLVPMAAALAFVVLPGGRAFRAPRAPELGFKKSDPDAPKGRSGRASIGPNEVRNPDETPSVESYLQRAYPADEISPDSTFNARQGWASLNAGPHSAGAWQLIGPSKATYP